MKQLEEFVLPLDRMLVHCRSLPCSLLGFPQQFTSTHLYTWVERGTVRVKCLAQEHNTMSPARAWTQTACSGVEHTNYEATAPPTNLARVQQKASVVLIIDHNKNWSKTLTLMTIHYSYISFNPQSKFRLYNPTTGHSFVQATAAPLRHICQFVNCSILSISLSGFCRISWDNR